MGKNRAEGRENGRKESERGEGRVERGRVSRYPILG